MNLKAGRSSGGHGLGSYRGSPVHHLLFASFEVGLVLQE